MKQNTKHNLAFIIIFIFAMILGGSSSVVGQVKGVLAGALFMGISILVLRKFPKEQRGEKIK